MEQRVRIQKLNPDGTAQVIHIRESACSGDCHKCSGCGAAQQTVELTAKNPIGAKVGELVIVQSGSGPVLAAAAVLYILPVVLFIGGYLLGELLWNRGGLTGCITFVLSIVLVRLYDRLVTKKQKTEYTITGYWEAAS